MDRKLIWLGICFVALAVSATAQTNVTNSNNGTSGTVPVYNGAASITNSPISVSGSNVGIGTTSPAFPLQVEGISRLDVPATGGYLQFHDTTGGTLLLINS